MFSVNKLRLSLSVWETHWKSLDLLQAYCPLRLSWSFFWPEPSPTLAVKGILPQTTLKSPGIQLWWVEGWAMIWPPQHSGCLWYHYRGWSLRSLVAGQREPQNISVLPQNNVWLGVNALECQASGKRPPWSGPQPSTWTPKALDQP